jgi:hypothetical protein
MSGSESQVQVQPDSSGKKVRTIEVTTILSGVATVVEMQVLAIADENGNTINEFIDYKWQLAVLNELKKIRRAVDKLNGDLTDED